MYCLLCDASQQKAPYIDQAYSLGKIEGKILIKP